MTWTLNVEVVAIVFILVAYLGWCAGSEWGLIATAVGIGIALRLPWLEVSRSHLQKPLGFLRLGNASPNATRWLDCSNGSDDRVAVHLTRGSRIQKHPSTRCNRPPGGDGLLQQDRSAWTCARKTHRAVLGSDQLQFLSLQLPRVYRRMQLPETMAARNIAPR